MRPFASGSLPVVWGVVAAPVLLGLALALSAWVSPLAAATLAAYYVLTLAYSFALKRHPVIDVMALAALYSIRIAGGATAAMVPISEWLLAFSVFIFLALAVVKRCGELARHEGEDKMDGPVGRGYRVGDLHVLSGLGSAAGFCAVLVMALYISSDQVKALYSRPEALWVCCFMLTYWVARMVLLSHRGEIHDDPVVFAATDKASLSAIAIMAAAVLCAM
jgi:4-hydroxybenzoate polyprenyltransferase